jgi:hypothetical protein
VRTEQARVWVILGLVAAGVAVGTSVLASGEAGWVKVAEDGLGGGSGEHVYTLAAFGGKLYAGGRGDDAHVWRWDSAGWTRVVSDGFGTSDNEAIDHMAVFGSELYATTMNEPLGGEIWRSDDGLAWTQVVSAGFGDDGNDEIMRLAVYSETLFASTWSWTTTHGAEIWSSPTGDAGDWVQEVANGFGDTNNEGVVAFEVYSDALYAGTVSQSTGGEVWRWPGTGSWTQVNVAGFGTVSNTAVSALAVFSDTLYASTETYRGSGRGLEVWSCRTCDGSDWARAVDNGFGDADLGGMSALEVYDDYLYLVANNYDTGVEAWRTADGTNWERASSPGFGSGDGYGTYWDNAVTVFDEGLYVGTYNTAGTGGTVWMHPAEQVFLPMALRNYDPCAAVYFDDFSDPNSGWYVGDESYGTFAYTGGEYQLYVKGSGAMWSWPGVTMSDGVLAAALRFATSGDDYDFGGLMFGKGSGVDDYYVFGVYRDGYSELLRHDHVGGWNVLAEGWAAGFAPYPASNRLKILRSGSTISAYVNDQPVATVTDSTYTGWRYVGVYAGTNTAANADIRFDDYGIYPVGCVGQVH